MKETMLTPADHITEVHQVGRSLYRSCQGSAGFFQQSQNELGALLTLLGMTEENFKEHRSYASFDPQIQNLSEECHKTFEDLQRLKTHYDCLPTQSQITWERMGWGDAEMGEIKSRITSHLNLLHIVNGNLIKYVLH